MSYIDRFGHGGHTDRKRMNVVGTLGRVVQLRAVANELLIATYCEPQTGTLFSRLAIFERSIYPANESGYHGFHPPTTRGYFNAAHEWIGLRP
jgi:hypothetical protein